MAEFHLRSHVFLLPPSCGAGSGWLNLQTVNESHLSRLSTATELYLLNSVLRKRVSKPGMLTHVTVILANPAKQSNNSTITGHMITPVMY